MDNLKENLYAVTEIKVEKINYTWTICNYSSICKKVGEAMFSPIFSTSGSKNVKWCLVLYPNGKGEEFKDNVGLFLRLVSGCGTNNKFHVQIRFSIVDGEQAEHSAQATEFLFSQPKLYGYSKFETRHYIRNKYNNLLPNDTLTIVCKMRVGKDNQKLSYQKERVEDFQAQFSDNLGLLLDDREFTDITLVIEDREFHVHKAILAAQSSVFMAMFKTHMKEKKESKVELIDFDSSVTSEMLHYMYTGKVNNLNKYSFDLLKIADKYDIGGLKCICENTICNKLNINNAIETLVLANSYNCQVLKKNVIEFIIAHKNFIIRTQTFETFKQCNPHLAVEVLHEIVDSSICTEIEKESN